MKKVWQPATLMSLEIQEHVLPLWKPPIKICLEPACQVDSSILKVRQVMLNSWGLLDKLLYASDLLCTQLYKNFLIILLNFCKNSLNSTLWISLALRKGWNTLWRSGKRLASLFMLIDKLTLFFTRVCELLLLLNFVLVAFVL